MTEGSEATLVAHPLSTTGQWIGTRARPLMSWLTAPVESTSEVGVVIAPAVGYEYWSSHRTLRTLAERLAGQGNCALRFDFDGSGDSAGDQWDPSRVQAWQMGVDLAAQALRNWGVSRLVVVGLRVGGTFALLRGSAVQADAVVAWAPVVRGRRYVSELKLLGLPVPETLGSPEGSGGIVQAGSVFSAETLADLSAINLTTLEERPAARVLIVDRADKSASTPLLDRLRQLGVEPDHVVAAGSELLLDRPTEYATVAEDIIDVICRWVDPDPDPDPSDAPTTAVVRDRRTTATVLWRGRAVEEEVVDLGAPGLVGILTRPSGASRGTVLWLNSGSEHHVGPGRAWVEYARELALSGFSSFRMDFSGWGESPDRDHAPGRPYDQHGTGEVAEAVGALREMGHQRVVLAGLCAGAWIGLRAALSVDVDGVIAINPQLYWRPGDPVEADIATETRVRRLPEIRRNKRLGSLGVWSVLDALGSRPPAATWLAQLVQRRTRVLAVFAEGDDGLEYLQDRTGRAWQRALREERIECVTVAGIDHPMHRHWYRTAMVETLANWLDTTFEVGPTQDHSHMSRQRRDPSVDA
jgi:alpha-beta hydrolase superfamily lysophospholipase